MLEVPYAQPRELAMEIQRFGGDVEIMAPAALRERVRRLLQDTLAAYR